MEAANLAAVFAGWLEVGTVSCDRKRPFTSATATVLWFGRRSATTIARLSLSRRNVGRRPRGRRPSGPFTTQPSWISCSVIRDTVLLCNPDALAKSAREIGCRRRIQLRTTPRLISRAVSLDATCMLVKLSRLIRFRLELKSQCRGNPRASANLRSQCCVCDRLNSRCELYTTGTQCQEKNISSL